MKKSILFENFVLQLVELKERQKMQLRQKAKKLGLDQE